VASADITFALSTIEDIFEVRVPRLQITKGAERVATPPNSVGGSEGSDLGSNSEQKKVLRREIRKWWEGVSDHLDTIVGPLPSLKCLFPKSTFRRKFLILKKAS